MKLSSDSKLQTQLTPFKTITLSEIDKVKLMRRVDTKYVFHLNQLPLVFEQFYQHYYLVEINGIAVQDYKTVYFDTPNYQFYLQHHNGIKNRFKVRFRTYINSDLSFLEVKHKTNKKETIKSRLEQAAIFEKLNNQHSDFISTKISKPFDNLTPSLGNRFNRITLVSKNFDERITIDSGISLVDLRNNTEKECRNLCIIETKRDIHMRNNTSARALQKLRIKPSGFSKYCMGLALTNAHIKKNLFKPRLLKFKSILN